MPIARKFRNRHYSQGSRPTVLYAFGISKSKKSDSSEMCFFLTQNWLMTTPPRKTISRDQKIAASNAISRAIDDHSKLNPRVRRPTWHGMFSFPLADNPYLDDSVLQKLAHDFMSEMGFQRCPWIATVHQDTNNLHIHLVASTVQDMPGYPVVAQFKDYDRAMEAMRRMEKKYDLTKVPCPTDGKKIDSPKEKTKKQLVRDVIDLALERVGAPPGRTLIALQTELKKLGVTLQIQWQNGAPRGVSYGLDTFNVSGSKLGAKGRYALSGLLEAGLELGTKIDLEALEATRNHSLTEMRERHQDMDFLVRVSMPSHDSDLLLESRRVCPPDHLESGNGIIIMWGYRVRVPKSSASKLSSSAILEALRAVGSALAEALRVAVSTLGALSRKIKAVEPISVPIKKDDPSPLTIRVGPRFNAGNQARRIFLQESDHDFHTEGDTAHAPTDRWPSTDLITRPQRGITKVDNSPATSPEP